MFSWYVQRQHHGIPVISLKRQEAGSLGAGMGVGKGGLLQRNTVFFGLHLGQLQEEALSVR